MNYVYFLQNNNSHIKIGATQNIKKRIKELQTGNSKELRLVGYIKIKEEENLFPFEKHTQGICEKYKLSGEWFLKESLNHLRKNPWYKENMITYDQKHI